MTRRSYNKNMHTLVGLLGERVTLGCGRLWSIYGRCLQWSIYGYKRDKIEWVRIVFATDHQPTT